MNNELEMLINKMLQEPIKITSVYGYWNSANCCGILFAVMPNADEDTMCDFSVKYMEYIEDKYGYRHKSDEDTTVVLAINENDNVIDYPCLYSEKESVLL